MFVFLLHLQETIVFINFPVFLSLSPQIHKQAPPLEDIAEDCSLAMRAFLERALERNPAVRSSASELLKDEAINPPREDQPRCWSLDSALEEATHTMLRQQSQHHDTTQGKELDANFCFSFTVKDKNAHINFSIPLQNPLFTLKTLATSGGRARCTLTSAPCRVTLNW